MDSNASQPSTNDPQTNRGVASRLVFFAFLAIVLVAFYFYSKPAKDEPSDQALTIGAQVVYVEGAVEYKDANGEWKRATNSTMLKIGSSVEIVGAGKAIINLDDGSAVRLNANSAITLASLDPKHIVITNDKGQVYNRVVPSERIFEVKANTTTYQALGTAYKTINESKLKGVEVYESKVKIIDENNKEVTVQSGSKYYVLNQDDKKAEKVVIKITKVEMDKDAFTKWNQAEDTKMTEEAAEETKTDEAETATEETKTDEVETPAASITLTGSSVSGGVSLSWKVSGVDTSSGFKIVKSASINPIYPGNDYIYLSESGARSYKWAIKDGKTYYFRVCQYLGGKCGVYSNNIKITAPAAETPTASGEVKSITAGSSGGSAVSWRVDGYSEMGFKIVWSKNSGPTYPTRDGDKYIYLSDPEARSTSLDAFDGEGSYYVRVCEYLGGSCGLYSNQIQVNL